MPDAEIGDLDIAYQIIDSGRPWILTLAGALPTGYGGVRQPGLALADRRRHMPTLPQASAERVDIRLLAGVPGY